MIRRKQQHDLVASGVTKWVFIGFGSAGLALVFALAFILGQTSNEPVRQSLEKNLVVVRQKVAQCTTERDHWRSKQKKRTNPKSPLYAVRQENEHLQQENNRLMEDNDALREERTILEETINELHFDLDSRTFVDERTEKSLQTFHGTGNITASFNKFFADSKDWGGIEKDELIRKLIDELKAKKTVYRTCRANVVETQQSLREKAKNMGSQQRGRQGSGENQSGQGGRGLGGQSGQGWQSRQQGGNGKWQGQQRRPSGKQQPQGEVDGPKSMGRGTEGQEEQLNWQQGVQQQQPEDAANQFSDGNTARPRRQGFNNQQQQQGGMGQQQQNQQVQQGQQGQQGRPQGWRGKLQGQGQGGQQMGQGWRQAALSGQAGVNGQQQQQQQPQQLSSDQPRMRQGTDGQSQTQNQQFGGMQGRQFGQQQGAQQFGAAQSNRVGRVGAVNGQIQQQQRMQQAAQGALPAGLRRPHQGEGKRMGKFGGKFGGKMMGKMGGKMMGKMGGKMMGKMGGKMMGKMGGKSMGQMGGQGMQ